jgi:hypothetical protein
MVLVERIVWDDNLFVVDSGEVRVREGKWWNHGEYCFLIPSTNVVFPYLYQLQRVRRTISGRIIWRSGQANERHSIFCGVVVGGGLPEVRWHGPSNRRTSF